MVVMVTHNGKESLVEYRENDEHFASFFRRTAIELNNTSIAFLRNGKHEIALQTLADAIKVMKYSIHKVGNEAEYRKDADESIRRAVEALRRGDGPPTRNIEGTNLSYGLRRLHDIDLNDTDIFSVEEESAILLFNIALTRRNHGISTSDHGSLHNSLSLLKLVIGLLHKKKSGEVTFKENRRPTLAKLHLLADTLFIMGEIYSHLGKHNFAEACFDRVTIITASFILEPSFSAAAA